jgi:hypothetical protein
MWGSAMNKQHRISRSSLASVFQAGLMALSVAMLLIVPVAGNAQDTTSSIRGKVNDESGNAISGASVIVEDLRNGVERDYATNSSGVFLATRLPAGGPYKITVDGTKSVDIPSITLADTYSVTINMTSAAAIEEIMVIGQTAKIADVAAGPSSVFSSFDIDTAVAFNRDIVDVYGLDPRVNIDNEDDGFAINCMGMHPRFNSVTLDGVSQNDRFGLNDNGYATATGMPFPYDAIEQIAVELAPFDVTYGGFSACNVNAVTRTGGNEWTGSVFYEMTNDGMKGTTIKEEVIKPPSYDAKTYGLSAGGPIIKDRLFVFGAYEFADSPRFISQGYNGSGNGDERDWLDQATYDLVEQTAISSYNYDPGGQPIDGSQENEKYMVRVDWNISDNHNASFIYNYFDGFQDRDSDSDPDEFEFANHFYQKGSESTTYTAKLASQWTDAFSTEVFYSDTAMNDSQVTVGPLDFGDHQIDYNGDTIYLGADDSRQANALNTSSQFLKIAGQLLLGNHVLSAGYERDNLEIFNQFVQHANGGEWDYYGIEDRNDDGTNETNPAICDGLDAAGRWANTDCFVSGVDQFVLGRPDRVYYGSAGVTNDPADAAAQFTNVQNTFYIQDEIFFDSLDLTLMAGIRYEWFESDDSPTFNQAFTDANNGLRNDATVDGVNLVMPRLGVTWNLRDNLTLRGGFGLYSGGNPNVWISNAYSNDGITNVQVRTNNEGNDDFFTDVVLTGEGRIGYDVPQELVDRVANTTADDAATRNLVLMDPDYEQPGIWKLALGATWDFAGGWTADFDYIYSQQDNPAIFVDVSQSIVGTTIIGQPIYDFTNGSDNLMLTNANDNGNAHLFSILMSKTWENGLDMSVGYSYTQAEDVSPMTSSVAVSNFENLATNDINNPGVGNSNYVVPNRFTFRFSYANELFGNNLTRFTLYGSASEGQSQSYGMGNSGQLEGDGRFARHMLYVPTGAGDPNVDFSAMSQENMDEMFAWFEAEGFSSGLQERNDLNAKWTTRVDLRIDQEFPTFMESTTGRLYLKVYNLGNLISSDWGTVNDAQFFTQQVVNTNVSDTGVYEFQSFRERDINNVRAIRSFYEVRLGIDILFGR